MQAHVCLRVQVCIHLLVQVESPLSIVAQGKASARRFLQAAFSTKFGAPPPGFQFGPGPSPAPSPGAPNETLVPGQAVWPSGPGLWPLGNKSRSGNNTSGDLLYSTDQQPPTWANPAAPPPISPPPAAVSPSPRSLNLRYARLQMWVGPGPAWPACKRPFWPRPSPHQRGVVQASAQTLMTTTLKDECVIAPAGTE